MQKKAAADEGVVAQKVGVENGWDRDGGRLVGSWVVDMGIGPTALGR